MPHDFDNEFCTLHEQQRENPLDGLLDVVGHESLYNLREGLYHMLERSVTNTYYDDESGEDKRDQFWHFQLILKCVERLYRIHNMIQAGELIYSYKPTPAK